MIYIIASLLVLMVFTLWICIGMCIEWMVGMCTTIEDSNQPHAMDTSDNGTSEGQRMDPTLTKMWVDRYNALKAIESVVNEERARKHALHMGSIAPQYRRPYEPILWEDIVS